MTPSLYAEPDTLSHLSNAGYPGYSWSLPDSALTEKIPAPRTAKVIPFPSARQVVGIHGFAQSGKNTAADYLVEQQGFKMVVLAEPILEALTLLDAPVGFDDLQDDMLSFSKALKRYGYEGSKKRFPEFRRQMQTFGTEVGREYLSRHLGLVGGVWLEIAEQKVSAPGKYVIPDVRFTDEVDFVRRMEGALIKVKRPGYGPVNAHVSDAGLPDHLFDHVIENDGTIADLHAKVAEIFGGR